MILFYDKQEFVSIVSYITFAACAFLIGLLLVGTTLLFYVKVNGSNITVRTRLGQKYEFNTLDIEKVIC